MAARGNITINDGEGTPVTHTFVADGDLALGVSRWLNRNASVPAASERITLSVKDSPAVPKDFSVPGTQVVPRIVEMRIRYPATYTDAVSGLTLVDFVDEAITTFRLHPRSSEQRAKNLRILNYNLHGAGGGNQVLYAIDKGEKVW